MFTVPPTFVRPAMGGFRGLGDATSPPAPDPEALTPEVVDAGPAPASHVDPTVPAQSPPSTYAVADFLDGSEGSAIRLAGLTLIRSVFIVPGLWAASKMTSVPLTFGQIAGFSLASSTTISVGMVGYYAFKRRRAARATS